MHNAWLNLLWKEWREHQWKLVSLLVIAFAVPLYQLATRPELVPVGVMMSVLGLTAFAPIYIGAGIAAAENRRRTIAFLQALPRPAWIWAITKILVGLVVLWIPLIALLLLVIGLASIGPWWGVDFLRQIEGDRVGGLSGFYAVQLLLILFVVPNVYMWSAAAGVNRSDEIRAGALAVAVMAGYWCLLLAGYRILQPSSDSFLSVVVSTAPAGIFGIMDTLQSNQQLRVGPILAYVIPQTLVNLILMAWFVLRFGQESRLADRSPQAAAPGRKLVREGIRRPGNSQTASILWMQWRELGLVAILCPVVTVAMAIVLAISSGPGPHGFADTVGTFLPMSICFMGLLFSTVLGAGVFLRDVEPGLNSFWRSRPANPSQWFWTKYLSGFTLWLVALGIPVLVLASLHPIQLSGRPWEPLVITASAGMAIFTSSVAAMCVVRQPVYACLLSLGLVLVLLGATLAKMDHDTVGIIAPVLMLGVIAASTLLAWLAIRNDWGWRSDA